MGTIDEEASPRRALQQPSTGCLAERGERTPSKRRAMNVDAVILRDDQFTELPKVKSNTARQRYLLGLTAAARSQSSTGLGSFGLQYGGASSMSFSLSLPSSASEREGYSRSHDQGSRPPEPDRTLGARLVERACQNAQPNCQRLGVRSNCHRRREEIAGPRGGSGSLKAVGATVAAARGNGSIARGTLLAKLAPGKRIGVAHKRTPRRHSS